jgi:hypothetical protein
VDRTVPAGAGVAPGSGIKFLRSGITSGNFVTLHSLTPGTSYNFFDPEAYPMYNHIAGPSGAKEKFLVVKFEQGSECPTRVGLSDLARYVDQTIFVLNSYVV